MSDCTGCRNAQVLFMLTELLWDDKSLSDIEGCQKTQVSDCTSSTVYIFRLSNVNEHNEYRLIQTDARVYNDAFRTFTFSMQQRVSFT